MNAHQARHILTTFGHVDGLLADVERLARESPSPFAKEQGDFAPDEVRLLTSFVELARTRMLAALDRLNIPRPKPTTSARWSASTSLTYADTALSEISESSLRGYGAIDPAVAGEIVALAMELRGLVNRGKALLHELESGGLRDRVAALPGYAGDVLRTIERLSAEHGLAQVRPLIAAAAERAGSATFDVGIFGRVSAGKSSLINALIDMPLLPVGATPVTAVPITIASGFPHATVRRLDDSALQIEIAEIPTYATEAENPHNIKGVRALDIRTPGVPPGLRFLDTPGVGSLGSSGPAQAFAWLPRCDLGLVLIAAGTAVAREDLALVAGLGNAGIASQVLLSKADVLVGADLERAIAYVHAEFAAVLGPTRDLIVRPVSAVAGHRAELDALKRDVLAPLAADHARAAGVALRSRLHRLVAATALSGGVSYAAPSNETYQARATAMEAVRRETDRLSESGDDVLSDTASAIADAWSRGDDASGAARSVLLNAGARSLAIVREAVVQVGIRAGVTAASIDGGGRRIPPLFDPDFLDAMPPLAPPALGRQLVGHRLARNRLESLAAPLRGALSRYSGRLYAWGTGLLDEMTDSTVGGSPSETPNRSELAALDELIDNAER